MEHKSVHKPWPYPNRFQVTAQRMKKRKILQKCSYVKYRKMVYSNEVHTLKEQKKSYETTSMALEYRDLMASYWLSNSEKKNANSNISQNS